MKSIWVKLSETGAKEVKDALGDVAARAQAISKMDPTLKIGVDKDGLARLRALRLELRALEDLGSKGNQGAFRNLAGQFRQIGADADGARLKTAALALELRAIRDLAQTGAADGSGRGGFWAGILGALGSRWAFGKAGSGLAGLFGGGAAGAAEGGAAGAAGAAGSGAAGGGGIVGGIGALGITASVITLLGTGIGGIIPLLAAATAGLGSFAALALPTFTGLASGLTAVSTATSNYQAASQALDIAINKSPADLAAYRAVLTGLEPDLAKAATLLTDQNVTWQALSPSMRKSVIALSDNSAALKTLLPDQRTALTALLAERTAWNNLTPAQQKAAVGYQRLSASYQAAQAKLAPVALQLATIGLSIANKIGPALVPFAQVAGKVLVNLATGFDKFASSPGFKTFLSDMLKLSGPAISTIGAGLGRVVIAVGKLLEALINPNGIKALRIVFTTIEWVVQGLAASIRWATPLIVTMFRNIAGWVRNAATWAGGLRSAWDAAMGGIGLALDTAGRFLDHFFTVDIPHWIDVGINWFKTLPGRIISSFGNPGGILAGVAGSIMSGFLSALQAGFGPIGSWLSSLGGIIQSLKGPIDKDRVLLVPAGIAIMAGLEGGMSKGVPRVLSLASQLGVQISDKLMDAFMSRNDKKADAAAAQIAVLLRDRIEQIRAYIIGVAQQETSWASIIGAASGPAFTGFAHWIKGTPGTGGTYSHTGPPTGGTAGTPGHWSGGVRPVSARGLLRNLNLDLHRLKAFAHVMARLRRMGLDPVLWQQILAAGPDQGFPVAEAILAAGRGEIRALDRTENAIYRTGVGLGISAAQSHFGSAPVNVIIHMHGLILGDQRALARIIQKILLDLKRHNGGGALNLG